MDAMVLVGFVHARSPWHYASRQVFVRAVAPEEPIRLITASLTMDEAVFLLLQELLIDPPYSITRSRSQYLTEHPEVVQQLMGTIDPVVQSLSELITLEPVLAEDVAAMRLEMLSSGLLPRDAIHVAVMRRLGIDAIASDDEAFERCTGIMLYRP
ncbi:MAG: type II toxin-antitoxin system VapC family toxin [Chloroflexi bacterium]|nr:type II toxin-antitoxin system VapC family toxin [Chloroflexota bacterium]